MNNAGGVVTLVLIYLLVFGGLGIGALVSYILRGVGHGLGMSQYTAGKMAEEGSTFEEILIYFFPGTALQEVAQIVDLGKEG